ncbi:MAG: hypothetical protein AAF789_08685, partial [Bacteroidota bacterium]
IVQSARLCGMSYQPPFAIMGTHKLSKTQLQEYGQQYRKMIELLQMEEIHVPDVSNCQFINEIPQLQEIQMQ